MKSILVLFLAATAVGCALRTPPPRLRKEPPSAPEDWRATMDLAAAKAKTKDFDYIIHHLIAPEFRKQLQAEYGSTWEIQFRQDRLFSLRYYLGWLKKAKTTITDNAVHLDGEHGCYATLVRIGNHWFLRDFGQRLDSM